MGLFFCINRNMNNLTDNINMLTPGGFKVSIDSKEFANLQFFCTNVALPSINQTEVLSTYKNNNAFFPGEIITYDAFTLTFIVDEEMKNYLEIFNWLSKNRRTNPIFKDITLSILSNKNTTNKQILFHDAFPTSLGSLDFTTQDTALDAITCSVIFRYNKFEFIK